MNYKIKIVLVDNPEYETEMNDIEELLKQHDESFDYEIPCYGNIRNKYKNDKNLFLPDHKIINLQQTYSQRNQCVMMVPEDIFFGRMNAYYDILKRKIFIHGVYDSKLIDVYQMYYYIKLNMHNDSYFMLPSNWIIFQSDNPINDDLYTNRVLLNNSLSISVFTPVSPFASISPFALTSPLASISPFASTSPLALPLPFTPASTSKSLIPITPDITEFPSMTHILMPTIHKITCQRKLLSTNFDFISIQNIFNADIPNVTIKDIFIMQNLENFIDCKNLEISLRKCNRIYTNVTMFQVGNTYYFTNSIKLADIYAYRDRCNYCYINMCEILFADESLLTIKSKYHVVNKLIAPPVPMFIAHNKNQLYYMYTIMYK